MDLDKFYVGTLCKRNHRFNGQDVSLRLVSGRHCWECSKMHKRKYARSARGSKLAQDMPDGRISQLSGMSVEEKAKVMRHLVSNYLDQVINTKEYFDFLEMMRDILDNVRDDKRVNYAELIRRELI